HRLLAEVDGFGVTPVRRTKRGRCTPIGAANAESASRAKLTRSLTAFLGRADGNLLSGVRCGSFGACPRHREINRRPPVVTNRRDQESTLRSVFIGAGGCGVLRSSSAQRVTRERRCPQLRIAKAPRCWIGRSLRRCLNPRQPTAALQFAG